MIFYAYWKQAGSRVDQAPIFLVDWISYVVTTYGALNSCGRNALNQVSLPKFLIACMFTCHVYFSSINDFVVEYCRLSPDCMLHFQSLLECLFYFSFFFLKKNHIYQSLSIYLTVLFEY